MPGETISIASPIRQQPWYELYMGFTVHSPLFNNEDKMQYTFDVPKKYSFFEVNDY